MAQSSEFRLFKEDKCDRCGECFTKCATLGLSEQAAKADIEALIAGRIEDSLAFAHCVTCNSCDLVCPQDANPFELILQRFGEYGKEHGVPYLAKMVYPNEPENLWTGLRAVMGDDEIGLLDSWRENLANKNDTVFLTGFYANIVPYLALSPMLDKLRPVMAGSEMLWGCGGDANKLGEAESVPKIAALARNQFAKMGAKKVVCFMEAEAALLSDVLPNQYGEKFDFEVTTMDDWLWERINSGKIEITNPLNITASVHDNCHSRYMDCRPMKTLRDISTAAGCSLTEMEHHKQDALCCGWAATIPTLFGESSGNPTNMLLYLMYNLKRRLDEALATGTDSMITGCPACYIFLSMMKELVNARIEIYHPLELLEIATGGTKSEKTPGRCWDLLALTTNLLINWGASSENRKRFHPTPPDPEVMGELPTLSDKDRRRIARLAKMLKGPLVQNKAARAATAASVKAAVGAYGKRLNKKLNI